jgi:serine/threonine-protein kinase RsbW
MGNQLELELIADLMELERVNTELDTFAERNAWATKCLFQIKLAIEEVVVNTISYGFSNQSAPRIVLKLRQAGARVTVEVSDNGMAFDPLEKPVPDLDASLEDRAIGGLGVYLVRQLMDQVTYAREGDWNRLHMTKKID